MLWGDKFREIIECRLQSFKYQAKADDIGFFEVFHIPEYHSGTCIAIHSSINKKATSQWYVMCIVLVRLLYYEYLRSYSNNLMAKYVTILVLNIKEKLWTKWGKYNKIQKRKDQSLDHSGNKRDENVN